MDLISKLSAGLLNLNIVSPAGREVSEIHTLAYSENVHLYFGFKVQCKSCITLTGSLDSLLFGCI